MRIKSQWFKPAAPRSAQRNASAIAFIVWRVAQNMLKRMRDAGFDIEVGTGYFDFMRETLVFLLLVADRMAHASLDGEARAEFTTALVRREAEILAENEDSLLGPAAPGGDDHRGSFIELFNRLAPHYGEFGFGNDGPDFAFVRYFGVRLEPQLPAKDRIWVLDQVMAIEAPEAVDLVRRGMEGVFSTEPRPARRTGMSGE